MPTDAPEPGPAGQIENELLTMSRLVSVGFQPGSRISDHSCWHVRQFDGKRSPSVNQLAIAPPR